MTGTSTKSGVADGADDGYRAVTAAIDQMRRREQTIALINPSSWRPAASPPSEWLSARLSIGALPQVLLPGCDERCVEFEHEPHAAVVLADLALDPTLPPRPGWWEAWNERLQDDLSGVRVWYAGSPRLLQTPAERQLRAGTGLTRVTVTDPYWVHYDSSYQESLYRIESGLHEGEALIAATFGLSPLLPGLAGVLIAPDHPPARDPAVAIRILSAGWASVERGLPFEV
jgi:hypothetical protein